MIKYKLIKNYPQFEMPLECHSIADGGYYTNKGDKVYNPENYPEFWEKIVKKNYKVLSFELNKKVFKLDENKNKYFAEDGNYANYVEMLNDNIILSIRRLSDGEIFTVGNVVESCCGKQKIIKIEIDYNEVWLHYFSSQPYTYRLNEVRHIKKALFTTEDGVDIFEGDEVNSVNKTTFILNCGNLNAGFITSNFIPNNNYLYFSTKSLAETFILMNKPCLSINDVLTSQDGLVFAEKKLKELVKSKL